MVVSLNKALTSLLIKLTTFLNMNTSFQKKDNKEVQEISLKEEEITDHKEDSITKDHKEDIMIDHKEMMIDHKEIKIDHKEIMKTDSQEELKVKKDQEEKDQLEITEKEEELMKEETTTETIDNQEDKIITEHTIGTLIEEDKTQTIMIDHQEDNLKDMNLEEKSSEKELQFNGLKLMKLVQEMKDLILLSKYF